MTTLLLAPFIAVGAIILWVALGKKKNESYVADPNSFQQDNVKVDFTTKMTTLGTRTFSNDKIRRWYAETSQPGGERWLRSATVFIEIDDFDYPVHKIKFSGLNGPEHARSFMQRFELALKK